MSARLEGKVALITGAASGIGLATAQRFAREGASVVLADRNPETLATALASLSADGAGHMALHLDVTQESGWAGAIAAVADRYGKLDILVNNAGFGRFCPIADTTLDEWRAIMAVNLDSVFLGTRHALPWLARAGRAAIVNVASMRGVAAAANTGAYCASKAGVLLFTKTTALECAAARNGVRANAVLPGHVETPLTAAAYADPAIAGPMLAHTPLGRFAQPGEIAEAIVFLASDESSYMTGSQLTIDGGVTA
jgi:NAD(P)-dependent dehydrogenase (short-subunit alcohol dehydrogenase family)